MNNDEVREIKSFVLANGDRVVDFVQGGCGVGDPMDRDVADVRNDVRDELVSFESAINDYGVAIDPETLEVDTEKTKALRHAHRQS